MSKTIKKATSAEVETNRRFRIGDIFRAIMKLVPLRGLLTLIKFKNKDSAAQLDLTLSQLDAILAGVRDSPSLPNAATALSSVTELVASVIQTLAVEEDKSGIVEALVIGIGSNIAGIISRQPAMGVLLADHERVTKLVTAGARQKIQDPVVYNTAVDIMLAAIFSAAIAIKLPPETQGA